MLFAQRLCLGVSYENLEQTAYQLLNCEHLDIFAVEDGSAGDGDEKEGTERRASLDTDQDEQPCISHGGAGQNDRGCHPTPQQGNFRPEEA